MKDIKWLKEEINKILRDKVSDGINYYDYMDLKNSFNELINQLDEPEVLSQEWIDENTYYVHDRESSMVYAIDLQNLLVSKQDVPVIPNYVSKWISVHHEQFDLYPALKRLENNALSWEDVYEWYRRNTHTFVKAYLSGKYEVEEEQKYVIKISEHDYMVMDDEGFMYPTDINVHKYKSEFTEQEVKGYDERFWPFAVKVEELEE